MIPANERKAFIEMLRNGKPADFIRFNGDEFKRADLILIITLLLENTYKCAAKNKILNSTALDLAAEWNIKKG